jgi:hypothetical protein
MRVLLDECLPRRLKSFLAEHDVITVPEAGWAGKKGEPVHFTTILDVGLTTQLARSIPLRYAAVAANERGTHDSQRKRNCDSRC